GSGVAVGDVNGDGWPDIYFARLDGPNKLYENEGGFRFKDITDSAGVADPGSYSTCAVFADVDGDGDLDLIVGSIAGKLKLYINDGNGHFKLKKNSGLGKAYGAMSMALADIDGDGDLDLYVANYRRKSVLDAFNAGDLTWNKTVKQKYRGPNKKYTLKPPYKNYYTLLKRNNKPPERRQVGHKDELFINNGNDTFTKVKNLKKRFLSSHGNPVGLKRGLGLTATFQDINQDGLPDLYISNDYWTKDRMWINQGNGIFKAENPLKVRDMSFSSMAVAFSDINRDGKWDYFTTEMLSPTHNEKMRQYIPTNAYPDSIESIRYQPQYNRNSLFVNRGDGTFAQVADYSGLAASGWSWACRFLDVNLDGYPDLLVTTGYSYDVQDLDAQNKWRRALSQGAGKRSSYIYVYPSLKLPNRIYENEKGLKFKNVSTKWGFHGKDVTPGLATADLNHDGSLDLVMNRLNKKAAIYKNITTAPRIAVRLIGKGPNTQAIGAKVRLIGGPGGPAPQMREVKDGGEYLSGSETQLMFAASKKNPDQKLKIIWPDGKKSTIDSVKANRIYEVNEKAIAKKSADSSGSSHDKKTIFKDVSGKIDHYQHHEDHFHDFHVQPLLPLRLSREGPGVSWIDYNGDGRSDLLISSGKGGKLAVFKNKGQGHFSHVKLGKVTKKTSADQTAILGWKGKKGTRIVVGNANFETGNIKTPAARTYLFSKGKEVKQDSIPGIYSTTGPLAAADYDHNGNVDLFVGGRFIPTQYPENARSRL
ncbi:MAG TPA: FG-GAP-like repeat-containing protein, partial [Balneolaceae bacterium]|nr:FG-GAP-like repeat-containing protein [Balneolaceae bacterium]